jgi:flagellar protein FlaG
MVDPISNAPVSRESGLSQSRPQASPSVPGTPDPATGLAPDQRIATLQAAVQKLIENNLPIPSKLQIDQDKETGTFIYRSIDPETGEVLGQWPSEQMIKLHDYLAQMEGMLVDKEV